MAEIESGEYVDVYVNFPSPEKRDDVDPNIRRWFAKSSPDVLGGVSPEMMMQRFDDAGIAMGLLNVSAGSVYANPHRGGWGDGFTLDDFRETCEKVASVVKANPGRLQGTCNIDPTQGMNAVRMVEIAVNEYDFRGVRVMGSLVNLPPNHPLYYPIYTKCIELDIPIVINVGFPGPLRFAKFQRPIDLDDVLITYPELKLVATHIGHPWHLETVALLQKHANLYLMTAGWSPKYIPDEIVHFMNTRGQHKVMWSADYPIQAFQRCVDEAHKLPLRDGVRRRYMRDNALEVFRFD
ncbi:MAG: amidohydrolase family protein [Chloroflexi bacterium]|nr:amidohydrolase family protein [Chloroflexota bacterium]